MPDAGDVFTAWHAKHASTTVYEAPAWVVMAVGAGVTLLVALVEWALRVEEKVPALRQPSYVASESMSKEQVVAHTQNELAKLAESPEFKRWQARKREEKYAENATHIARVSMVIGILYAALMVWKWTSVENVKECVVMCGMLQFAAMFKHLHSSASSLAPFAVMGLSTAVYAHLIAPEQGVPAEGVLVLRCGFALAAAHMVLGMYEAYQIATHRVAMQE